MGAGQSDFHPLKVCSCKKCEDREQFECKWKDYHTKLILSCPLHSLAYEIECDRRASMADFLVHPILKRSHSNWLEALHNVLIRFRPKHIHLERIHYETSTNLGLLQSGMTYMNSKHGPSYHWVPELFKRLGLPVFEGLRKELEAANQRRNRKLDLSKTEVVMRRRIQLNRERVLDSQRRKEWSKAHGQDTYVSVDEGDTVQEVDVKGKCKCGSTTHSRPTHRDCSLSKKRRVDVPDSPRDYVIPSESDDSDTHLVGGLSSDACSSADESSDERLHDDDLISGSLCECGALNRAHKTYCPMNIRNRSGRVLFPPKDDLPARPDDPDVCEQSASGVGEGEIGLFKPGECVYIHSNKLSEHHIPCCIVQMIGKFYRVCSKKGVLIGWYSSSDLMASSCDFSIPLGQWCQNPMVSLCEMISDPSCLEKCTCTLKSPLVAIDLTEDSGESDDNHTPIGDRVWLKNLLYTLGDRER